VIKSKDKRNYLIALNKADAGNAEAFTQYIGQQSIWSLNMEIKAAKGQVIDEPEDLDKKIELLNREISDKLDIVEKSNQQVALILSNVYLPLIQYTYNRVQKLAVLFEGKALTYFQEPEELEGNIPMVPLEAQTIEDLANYFLGLARKNGNSFHRFKTGIWLVNYRKATKKFGVEVSFRIYFDKFDYNIESTISEPSASGYILRRFVELIKRIDPDTPGDKFEVIDVPIGKWKYLEKVTGKFLQPKADEIANRTFDFIEERIKNLKE
jgi:hypothetical protein